MCAQVLHPLQQDRLLRVTRHEQDFNARPRDLELFCQDPPASRPTASIFWAWRNCISNCFFSVMSVKKTRAADSPSQAIWTALISTQMIFPSRSIRRKEYLAGAPSPGLRDE
jgi:hypothetical protein